jgi:hypothetical protein
MERGTDRTSRVSVKPMCRIIIWIDDEINRRAWLAGNLDVTLIP